MLPSQACTGTKPPAVAAIANVPEGRKVMSLGLLNGVITVGVAPAVSNQSSPELVTTSSLPLSGENAAAVAFTTCFVPFNRVVTVEPLYRNTSEAFEVTTALPFGATAKTLPGAPTVETVFAVASTTISPALW